MKLFFVWIIVTASLFAQQHTKTNLEMLAALIDSSFLHITGESMHNADLKIITSGSHTVLYANIQAAFARMKSHSAGQSVGTSTIQLVYTVEDAKIVYENLTRDGIFGDVKLIRKASLRGSFLVIPGDQTPQKFSLSSTDTIGLENRQQVESASYSFLSPVVPANTSFDTLWEPAAVVAAVGVAVYLLFSVRKTN